jgi:putative colanic acid biosynthesis acetyltransferase WcaF
MKSSSNPALLDAAAHEPLHGGPSFSLANRVLRAVWRVTWWGLASWTPRQLHPWRRFLLRLFGASMASGSDVRGSARVWLPQNLSMGADSVIAQGVICYNQAPVSVGNRVLVSQRAHLCAGTHDYNDPDFQLVARPIAIQDDAWLAAECFVGPGVRVGAGAVLGARGVAFGTLEPWTVYTGNPARVVKARRRPPGASKDNDA